MKTISIKRKVQVSDTDLSGATYFANFFKWMQEAETELFNALNAPSVIFNQDTITGWPRVNVQCSFENPLFLGDTVEIHLTVKEARVHSIVYEIHFAKEMPNGTRIQVASGSMTTVCAKMNRQTGAFEKIPLAETLLSKLQVKKQEHAVFNPSREY